MSAVRVCFTDSKIDEVAKYVKLIDGCDGFKIERESEIGDRTETLITEYKGYSLPIEVGYDQSFGAVTALIGKS